MGGIRHAVILAGGLGTRMLPASIYSPKEGLPLVDTPIIHHLIWESAKAGVEEIHIVLSKEKEDLWGEVLDGTARVPEDARLDLPRSALTPLVEGLKIILHIQKDPGGVGDAIQTAIGEIDEPFLVILGDNLLIKDHVGPSHSGPANASEASLELVKKFQECGGVPCVGLKKIYGEDVSKYGCVEIEGKQVTSIIEKPNHAGATSMYALCGRYILPGGTGEILEKCKVEEFGELQSIALLERIIDDTGLIAVSLDDFELYDSGDPLSWLKAQIDHSLRRDDIGEKIGIWIANRLQEK